MGGKVAARKVILTCAVTGGHRFNPKHPNYPVSPQQIADAAFEAQDAGASAVHLHARDSKTTHGTREPAVFKQLVDILHRRNFKAILNLTCGSGATYIPSDDNDAVAGSGTDVGSVEDRVRHIEQCRPEVCSFDVTTQNQVEDGLEYVYLHSHRTLRGMAKAFQRFGVKPELEIFSPGDILFAKQLQAESLLHEPVFFQMVLGTPYGLPSNVETVLYLRQLLPAGAMWSAFGLGAQQMPMVAQSVLLGGHARVGLEDNLYLRRGVFATNGELVARAVRIIEDLGHSVASPEEARQMLGMPGRRDSTVAGVVSSIAVD
jgi:uncharacterized protein (DUF849 family)